MFGGVWPSHWIHCRGRAGPVATDGRPGPGDEHASHRRTLVHRASSMGRTGDGSGHPVLPLGAVSRSNHRPGWHCWRIKVVADGACGHNIDGLKRAGGALALPDSGELHPTPPGTLGMLTSPAQPTGLPTLVVWQWTQPGIGWSADRRQCPDVVAADLLGESGGPSRHRDHRWGRRGSPARGSVVPRARMRGRVHHLRRNRLRPGRNTSSSATGP